MRFWLARNTSVPIREQLCAQLILGILSRKFRPGERLPSVRNLARRLKIHANTVSAAYQDLAARGWVIRRTGSGVFVNDRTASGGVDSVEAYARECVEGGLARGFSLESLGAAFSAVWRQVNAGQLVVVDPELALAEVLAKEIGGALGREIPAFAIADCTGALLEQCCVLANEAHLPSFAALFPAAEFRGIRLRSMEDVIADQTRPESPILIAIVSRSESILSWSRTLLAALGFPPEAHVPKNPAEFGWRDGLGACAITATDVVSAREFPSHKMPIVFHVVDEQWLAELRESVAAGNDAMTAKKV